MQKIVPSASDGCVHCHSVRGCCGRHPACCATNLGRQGAAGVIDSCIGITSGDWANGRAIAPEMLWKCCCAVPMRLLKSLSAVQYLFNAPDGFARLALEHKLRPSARLQAVCVLRLQALVRRNIHHGKPPSYLATAADGTVVPETADNILHGIAGRHCRPYHAPAGGWSWGASDMRAARSASSLSGTA